MSHRKQKTSGISNNAPSTACFAKSARNSARLVRLNPKRASIAKVP